MDLELVKLSDNKRDIKQFIKAQWLFYRGNPCFVPPVIKEEIKLFDKHNNPLYEHADYQLFFVKFEGTIVGRIAAIENHLHNQIHQDKVGFFGFFECIDNQLVADMLFNAAKQWLMSRGLDIMRGPANPTFNDVIGFLLDGFNMPPVTLSPYTSEYYLKLAERYGFYKAKDLYAYKLVYSDYRSDKMKRLHSVIQERTQAKIYEVNFKDKESLAKNIKIMKDIYNAAWEKNWSFVKMTDAEFDYLAQSLVPVGVSELTLIIEVDNKPAGFALGLPDINQALIYNRSGSYIGAGWRLWSKKKHINTARIIVLGILPEYRNMGLDALLYNYIGEAADKLGYNIGDASWILEDNEQMNKGMTQTMNALLYKKFRVYEMKI